MNCPRPIKVVLISIGVSAAAGATLHAAEESDDPRKLADYRTFALNHEGDAAAGEKIFRDNRQAVCGDCHRVTGMEKSGPNLDGIGEKYSRDELISHLLEPSVSIKPGFEQALVLMTDGRLLNGRVERWNKLVLRLIDAQGTQHNLDSTKIEQVRYSDVSLMPTGLVSGISKRQFADLIAYLSTLKFGVKHGLSADGKIVEIPRLAKPVAFVPVHPSSITFDNPVWCGGMPGTESDLLVIEHHAAKIWRYRPNAKPPRKQLFLDLSSETHIGSNQGLMCLALHPDYLDNGRYFLEHEVREQGTVKTTVVERMATPDRLRDSGERSIRLLEVEQPAGNHNGGCIAFGTDGMLYAGFGDGGPQKDPNGYSQNPRELLGSFVRIDVDDDDPQRPYAIPEDNPFLAAHQDDPSIRPETWAIGFREPWRFSFDPLTGDLWVGDVGQSKFEEVCLVNGGENHGWNVREGFASFSPQYRRDGERFTDPIFAYEHGLGFSVTGGHVYRGDPDSSFYGVYVFGDYNTRRVWGLRRDDGGGLTVRELGTAPGGIASFGVDQRGEILLVTYGGTIFRLDLSGTSFAR